MAALSAAIKWRPILDGLINEYERVALIPRSRAMTEIWNPTGASMHERQARDV